MDLTEREARIAFVVDRYEHPRYRGTPHGAGDVTTLTGGNPGCGDIITIHLRTTGEGASERVAALAFEGKGCTLSQAAADIAVELAGFQTLDDILAMTIDDLASRIGRDLVESRIRCAALGLDTVKAAIQRLRRDRRRRELGLPPEPPAVIPDLAGVPGGPDPFGVSTGR